MLRYWLFSCLTCLTYLLSISAHSQQVSQPIRIIINNWTSQQVLAHVVGDIYQTRGFSVEYINLSTAEQWGALAHGAADIQVEVWQGTMEDEFERMVGLKAFVDAGAHTAKTREEWWVPAYVKPLCPGLPDWQALKKCYALFARPGSQGRGVYFAGPWEKPDEARIRALDLNFDIRILNDGDDLWIELAKAYANQQPIVLFNWTPNWVESEYQGDFIEFPDHKPRCETDPEWGVNRQFLYDCGNPKDGWLKKAASNQFEQTYPCAFQILKNINFSNQQIASASALVDVKKMTVAEAAEKWMTENKADWQSWLVEGCQP